MNTNEECSLNIIKGDRRFCRKWLLWLAEMKSKEVSSCQTYYCSDGRTHSAKFACFALARAVSEFPSAAARILPGAFLTCLKDLERIHPFQSTNEACQIMFIMSSCFEDPHLFHNDQYAINMFRWVQIEDRCWNSKTKLVACSRRQPPKSLPSIQKCSIEMNWKEQTKIKPAWSEYNSFYDASNWCFSVNDRRHQESIVQKIRFCGEVMWSFRSPMRSSFRFIASARQVSSRPAAPAVLASLGLAAATAWVARCVVCSGCTHPPWPNQEWRQVK